MTSQQGIFTKPQGKREFSVPPASEERCSASLLLCFSKEECLGAYPRHQGIITSTSNEDHHEPTLLGYQEATGKAIPEKQFPGSKQPISEPGRNDCQINSSKIDCFKKQS